MKEALALHVQQWAKWSIQLGDMTDIVDIADMADVADMADMAGTMSMEPFLFREIN